MLFPVLVRLLYSHDKSVLLVELTSPHFPFFLHLYTLSSYVLPSLMSSNCSYSSGIYTIPPSFTTPYTCNNTGSPSFDNTISSLLTIYKPLRQLPVIEYFDNGFFSVSAFHARSAMDWAWLTIGSNANMMM